MSVFKKTTRKVCAIALAAAMLTSTTAFTEIGTFIGTNISVSAASATPVSSFEYETNSDGNITITKFIGSETKVVIPKKIDGKTVTIIGYRAFSNNYKITSVTLPSSITTIDRYAFSGSTYIESITFPAGIKEINEGAFSNCFSIESVTIPDSVELLGSDAFNYCKSLVDIKIPENPKFSLTDSFNNTK